MIEFAREARREVTVSSDSEYVEVFISSLKGLGAMLMYSLAKLGACDGYSEDEPLTGLSLDGAIDGDLSHAEY